AMLFDQPRKRVNIHVSLERQLELRVRGLRKRKIDGSRASVFDICPRGVEMRIARDDVALLAHDREQDPLGGAALMRRNHVFESGEFPNDILQPEEALAPGV